MKIILIKRSFTFSIIAVFLTCAFLSIQTYAQRQVANFSTGKAGTKSYEHFSFQVEDGVRGDITYSYGENPREINLNYFGRATLDGIAVFKLEFPNNKVFYVIPQKTTLKVVGEKGNYSKIFSWEYEGPVNGIGTWCDSCTEDGKESIAMVRRYFF